MLRTIFVLIIVVLGLLFAFKGPFYILLFYFWNAYFRPESWAWSPLIYQLNLSLVLGSILLVSSFMTLARIRLSLLLFLVLFFFLDSFLSVMYSEHFDRSLRWWTDFAKVIVIVIITAALVNDRRRYRWCLVIIAYSLGLEAAKQGWVLMVLSPGASNQNMHAMLGDNNGVAVGMMMLIPLFFALDQTANYRWEKYLHRFFIVGVFYRGISTYSRGGFLTAAVLGLMLFWYAPRKFRAIFLVATLASVVFLAMPQQFWDRMQTMFVPMEQRDASQQSRLFLWQVAITMAQAKPVTGVGFNAFPLSLDTYDPTSGGYGEYKAVHSAWFGVLAEMGYPGLVLLILVVVTGVRTASRVRRMTRGHPDLRDINLYAAAMQMSLVCYAVGDSFVNGQYNEFFWHLIGLNMALQAIAYDLIAQKATAEIKPGFQPVIRPRYSPS